MTLRRCATRRQIDYSVFLFNRDIKLIFHTVNRTLRAWQNRFGYQNDLFILRFMFIKAVIVNLYGNIENRRNWIRWNRHRARSISMSLRCICFIHIHIFFKICGCVQYPEFFHQIGMIHPHFVGLVRCSATSLLPSSFSFRSIVSATCYNQYSECMLIEELPLVNQKPFA